MAPAAVPLLGHVPAFKRDRVGLLQECVETPGDVVELRLGRPAYLLKRAEDVQHVLVARHESYPKSIRNIGPRARRIFGDGVMTSTGNEHRRMKVRAAPVFRRDPVTRLNGVIQRSVDAMLDRWEHVAEVDLADEMDRLARQTSIASIFGIESGPRFEALEEGMDARDHARTRAFDWPVTEPAFLPLAVRPRLRRAIRRLDDTVEELIREQRDRAAPDDNLLSMLMDTHAGRAGGVRPASDPRRGAQPPARIPHEPRPGADLHRGSGRRPSGRRGEAPSTRWPTCSGTVSRGATTGRRCATRAWSWPSHCGCGHRARSFSGSPVHDDVLPTGTRVRAGSKLLLSPYVLQRDPAYYPDPERFDPERFSEDGGRGRPKYAYFPFGGGPRVCIGQALSTLETTLVVARMAQRVRFDLSGRAAGLRLRLSVRHGGAQNAGGRASARSACGRGPRSAGALPGPDSPAVR